MASYPSIRLSEKIMLKRIVRFLRRAYRSVIFRSSTIFVKPWLAAFGITFRGRCVFVGCPIVDMAENSVIEIGDNCVLTSMAFATALGVNHPVILRTLHPGAMIRLESGVGMSGTTICAAKEVTIGSDTMIGANVTIADSDFHPLEPANRKNSLEAFQNAQAVRIGRNVFIGTGAILLKGAQVGDNSVIGAGSVVSSSIPENVVAVGIPCRVLKSL